MVRAMTTDQLLQTAAEHHDAGRLADAEPLYREVLTREPDQVDALHYLGLLCFQIGRTAEALELLDKAVALELDIPELHATRGRVLAMLGRIEDAIDAWQKALALNPEDAAGHSAIGSLLLLQGKKEQAIGAFRAAVKLRGDDAAAWNNLGFLLLETKQLDEAIVACQRAAELQPNSAETWMNLGIVLSTQGQTAEAVEAYRRAVNARPDFIDAYCNITMGLRDLKRLDEAFEMASRAVQVRPDSGKAQTNLGLVLEDRLQTEAAMNAYRRAIELQNDLPEPYNNLGILLHDAGRDDEAIEMCRKALAIKPEYSDAWSSLGNALGSLDRIDESIDAYRRAVALKPDEAMGHSNLGLALVAKGEMDAAIASYRRGAAVQSEFPSTRLNLGLALLAKGEWLEGWRLYEYRWKVPPQSRLWRDFGLPRWDGSPLQGKRILITTEQGFGDAIQFVRYARVLAGLGGRVIVECEWPLRRLFANVEGIEQAVKQGEKLPDADVFCPIGSLPLALGTTERTIPADVPYIRADVGAAARWRARLDAHVPADGSANDARRRLNVGLAWAGNPKPNPRRTIPLALLSPLGAIGGIRFISLQKGDAARAAACPPAGMELVDWTADLSDFAATAALMATLDLVISIDSGVAHLAGAMAKPLWVMLPFNGDWRWLLDRSDSPWYPTMRLFRQSTIGDWSVPVAGVAKAIAELAAR
jgi:tetratricopeptide (TPR) repeat protein